MVQINIGSVERQKFNLNILLWGKPKAGKTILASTAPGKKLFIEFDNNGDVVLNQSPYTEECKVFKAYVNLHIDLVKSAYGSFENPFGIDQYVKENKIETLVFDSLTSYDDLCMQYAVKEVKGATTNTPTLQGYGIRNIAVMEAMRNLMAYASRNNLNLIVIAHAAPPEKDESTGSMSETILAGGKLPTILPTKFDEIWYLDKRGADYFIMLNSTRKISPMGSRMFSSAPEFQWKFDMKTDKHTIKEWYAQWVAGNGMKIPIPA